MPGPSLGTSDEGSHVFKFVFMIYFYFWVGVLCCMYVYAPCACLVPEESVGTSKTGETDVVSRHVGSSNQKWVLLESSQSL